MNNINYEFLVTELVREHKKEDLYMSGARESLWLPCYHDIGQLIRWLEQQGFRGNDHLRELSHFLTRGFATTDPLRFSIDQLLRMKEFSDDCMRIFDPAKWAATRRQTWHGRMPSNFDNTLSDNLRDLAQSIFKSSYCIPMPDRGDISELKEADLEEAFVTNINSALKELGPGFSFKSRQCKINITRQRRCDLLFYQDLLRCHVIIELKRGKFRSGDIGGLTDYLQHADRSLKGNYDNQTIGIILCRAMDEEEVEATLHDYNRPIGVATYRF